MRSDAAEQMDGSDAAEPEFAAALADLRLLNRISRGFPPVLRWLDRLVAATGATRLSVLDVGAGGGDLLAAIDAWGARQGVEVTLAGLDRSPWARRFAATAGVRAEWIEADLFDLDPTRRFDVVVCSLFAHHLDDAQMVRFLGWLEARARLGWLISDLHRHPVAWAGVWAGTRALRLAPMVRHDGPISVARAFTRADWDRLLAAAGVAAEIAWVFPFRWQVGVIRA